MKIVFISLFSLFILHTSHGLQCWECNNARTNDQCLMTGRMTNCREKDAICEDQIRHLNGGSIVLIEKRCKQRLACVNNVNQNIRRAYPIQCNLRSPSSTCRCCCDRDMCNVRLLSCWREIPQYDSPIITSPNVICERQPEVPAHTNRQCTGNSEPGTYCDFHCHDNYVMVGRPKITCQMDLTWDYPPPTCKPITCPPARVAPKNGAVTCSDGINLRSRCTYTCRQDYALVGGSYANCVDSGKGDGTGIWTANPTCKPLFCPRQSRIKNGGVRCTRGNRFNSVCRFRCNKGYEVYPGNYTQPQCTFSGNWSATPPCCTRPCPPHIVMDFVVVLDSSSSVGVRNWGLMKSFVRSFLDDFTVGERAAHYAVVRYNREVDEVTQILLNDYPNDREALLRAYDAIPYDGSGTRTGRALLHTANVLLRTGNRPEARDVVLLITDGASQDNVAIPARFVRANGALLYVLPVRPPGGGVINMEQIREIAGPGNERNILTQALDGGFEALDENFARDISELLCSEPCVDPFDRD